jgi:ribosomal-protein-alanine N-acetyltransferase
MASHVAGICELEAVVVRAAARSQGFGTQLIQAVAAWGQALGATRLELEVRPSNTPALRLYQRLGFTHDGTRPAYYHNPEEDAVLMSLDLSAR